MKIAHLATLGLLLSFSALADTYVGCYTNDANSRADIVIEDLARQAIGPNQAVALYEAMNTTTAAGADKTFESKSVQLTCKAPVKAAEDAPAQSSCTLTLLTQNDNSLYDSDMDRVVFDAPREEAQLIAALFGATVESPFSFSAGRAQFLSTPESFEFRCQY